MKSQNWKVSNGRFGDISLRSAKAFLSISILCLFLLGCASRQPLTRTIIVPPVDKIQIPKEPEVGPIKGYKPLKKGKQTITIGPAGGNYFPRSEFENMLWRDAVLKHYRDMLKSQIGRHNASVDEWLKKRDQLIDEQP